MKKKSKKKFSEAANVKLQTKKLNPFEVHINRRKYDVLGMKSKNERGLPGISRARSLKKRKGTLLQEYKYKDKKNLFLDRRIGERNTAMTAEDKILARYTAERMKFHSKKSIFNLGDNEELTHKGQTLSEIEKFEDPKSEDEDDEERDGKLDSDFVEDAHFGGGIFKKIEGESKSRKDLIDQLIAESIKRKAEKQKLKEETLDLTEKLDTEWKELLPLVTATKKSKGDVELDNKDNKFANYDILSKKLKFESRGKPSDRLKSEEEIAKEEKEKLERLEKERLQRMLGDSVTKTVKHRSADDMDDGFDLSQPEIVLTYKNGILNVEGEDGLSDSDKEMPDANDKAEEEESDDEKNEEGEEGENDDGSEEEEEEEGEDDESESDNFSDLKDSEESDVEESTKMETDDNSPKEKIDKKNLQPPEQDEKLEADDSAKAKAKEEAEKELPYTFEIPKEYEDFEKLMSQHNSDFQAVIVERMIKCHHPSLKEEFKEDLDLLFTFLMQHLQDCASSSATKVDCFKVLDRLSPWLFDLTQWNPKNSSSALIEIIKEKYQDYLKKPKAYPTIDTLVFLKLVSILFPTSDYKHPVVTPCMLFMEQMLYTCTVRSSIDLSVGLFITTLVYEYSAYSKRFVPEAINFIHGVLRLAHPKTSDIPVEPPFTFATEDSFNLNVADKSSVVEIGKLTVEDLFKENCSDEFKTNSTFLALTLLSRFCDYWKENPSAILIFQHFIPLLNANEFSECLKQNVEEAREKILNFKKENLKMLVFQKKKPKPLRLYEPNIEEVYSLKKYRKMGKKKAEKAKLLHKYKREMKGALREIRRDRSFLAKLKFREIVKSDMERKQKVREIFGAAAEQAGELRKIQRKKKF